MTIFKVMERGNQLINSLVFFLIKLVNEKGTYWDEYLSIILFSHKIAYKVVTRHTISIYVWTTSIVSY
jgi:hypothetical protein